MFWSLFVGIVLVSVLVFPACADEINPTITHVFFVKDGLPYNGSVVFSVHCYGYPCTGWDCGSPEDLLAKNGNYSPEEVFSFHASCPTYGCLIYEPYYHAGRSYTDYCTLDGETPGGKFTIPNFSNTPTPDCSDLHQFAFGMGQNRYYNGTPAYDACINQSRQEAGLCNRYVTGCSPAADEGCGNWILDGRPVKDTQESITCRGEADADRQKCDQYLEKIDPSEMIMWMDTDSGREEPAQRECELRFTIPSGNQTPPPSDIPLQRTSAPKNPVEFLYCSLLSFFGASC